MKYYDKKNNRLVYVSSQATSNFWDEQWSKKDIKKIYAQKIYSFDPLIKFTKKYLPNKKSIILECGCGMGQNVYKLNKVGYKNTIGLDYAKETIKLIQKFKPKLNVVLGDVMKLPFKDNHFDGYWSFGVIEHFYDGYKPIADEMSRVVKKDGYLFLVFPHMSKLRKLKSNLGFYSKWSGENKKDFYQFALDEKLVTKRFEELGFKLVEIAYRDGFKGLKDESGIITPILSKIYGSSNFFAKGRSFVISRLFSRVSSHSILLVLKKVK
ncbi:MAG: class I SAM-dependent methyltransferase [Candidatus Woesearchaeota archaeon]|jgi:SAM-dependent methyltransferase|nr:class I SAM-dependent methyltransferase [Candidatus Woesearchaeota archaeon]